MHYVNVMPNGQIAASLYLTLHFWRQQQHGILPNIKLAHASYPLRDLTQQLSRPKCYGSACIRALLEVSAPAHCRSEAFKRWFLCRTACRGAPSIEKAIFVPATQCETLHRTYYCCPSAPAVRFIEDHEQLMRLERRCLEGLLVVILGQDTPAHLAIVQNPLELSPVCMFTLLCCCCNSSCNSLRDVAQVQARQQCPCT